MSGPTEVYAEMILASGDVGVRVMMKLFHRMLMEMECQRTELPVLQFLFLKGKVIS